MMARARQRWEQSLGTQETLCAMAQAHGYAPTFDDAYTGRRTYQRPGTDRALTLDNVGGWFAHHGDACNIRAGWGEHSLARYLAETV
jgi:hypothetical protein